MYNPKYPLLNTGNSLLIIGFLSCNEINWAKQQLRNHFFLRLFLYHLKAFQDTRYVPEYVNKLYYHKYLFQSQVVGRFLIYIPITLIENECQHPISTLFCPFAFDTGNEILRALQPILLIRTDIMRTLLSRIIHVDNPADNLRKLLKLIFPI